MNTMPDIPDEHPEYANIAQVLRAKTVKDAYKQFDSLGFIITGSDVANKKQFEHIISQNVNNYTTLLDLLQTNADTDTITKRLKNAKKELTDKLKEIRETYAQKNTTLNSGEEYNALSSFIGLSSDGNSRFEEYVKESNILLDVNNILDKKGVKGLEKHLKKVKIIKDHVAIYDKLEQERKEELAKSQKSKDKRGIFARGIRSFVSLFEPEQEVAPNNALEEIIEPRTVPDKKVEEPSSPCQEKDNLLLTLGSYGSALLKKTKQRLTDLSSAVTEKFSSIKNPYAKNEKEQILADDSIKKPKPVIKTEEPKQNKESWYSRNHKIVKNTTYTLAGTAILLSSIAIYKAVDSLKNQKVIPVIEETTTQKPTIQDAPVIEHKFFLDNKYELIKTDFTLEELQTVGKRGLEAIGRLLFGNEHITYEKGGFMDTFSQLAGVNIFAKDPEWDKKHIAEPHASDPYNNKLFDENIKLLHNNLQILVTPNPSSVKNPNTTNNPNTNTSLNNYRHDTLYLFISNNSPQNKPQESSTGKGLEYTLDDISANRDALTTREKKERDSREYVRISQMYNLAPTKSTMKEIAKKFSIQEDNVGSVIWESRTYEGADAINTANLKSELTERDSAMLIHAYLTNKVDDVSKVYADINDANLGSKTSVYKALDIATEKLYNDGKLNGTLNNSRFRKKGMTGTERIELANNLSEAYQLQTAEQI